MAANGTPGGAVVVTGASSGIGRHAALWLNAHGYTVWAGVRKDADGEAVAADAPRPAALHPLILDVTDPAQVEAAFAQVAAASPNGIRALFSNAGIANYDGDVSCEGTDDDRLARVMQVNFFGAVRFIRTFLPAVRAAKGTVVVNSALMARTVIPFNGGYASSKAALEAWCDALRREVRPFGVRVALIEAAAVATALDAKQSPDSVPDDTPYRAMKPFVTSSLAQMQKFAHAKSTQPDNVAALVQRLIEAKRPAPRTIVGGGARPIWIVGGLPDRVQDRIFATAMARFARKG